MRYMLMSGRRGGSPPVAPFSDNFNRADSASLGNGWTSGDWGISSNAAYRGASFLWGVASHAQPGGADMYAKMTLGAIPHDTYFGVAVRLDPAVGDYYWVVTIPDGQVKLAYTDSGGTIHELAASATGVVTAGDVLRIEVHDVSGGNYLEVFVNGDSVLTTTDTTYDPQGTAACMIHVGSASTADDFEAGAV